MFSLILHEFYLYVSYLGNKLHQDALGDPKYHCFFKVV